jgi:hypothetical protein
MTTIGGMGKLRHGDGRLVTLTFTFTVAACNIVGMARLLEATF